MLPWRRSGRANLQWELPNFDEFHERLTGFVRTFAEAAGVSRPPLTKLHKTKAQPTKRMRGKLEEAFTILEVSRRHNALRRRRRWSG